METLILKKYLCIPLISYSWNTRPTLCFLEFHCVSSAKPKNGFDFERTKEKRDSLRLKTK